MRSQKLNKYLCLYLAVISVCFLCNHRVIAAEESKGIQTVDIGIRPSAYRELISNEAEPRFTVRISTNSGPLFRGKIKLRGAASKEMGLLSPMKRIPIEMQLDPEDALAQRLSNSTVKLINSYTPFRLCGEYTALELFRFAGVPVPEHELVFLRYNGVDFGLYLAVEELNETFLAKYFPGGTLYKADSVNFEKSTSISSWFGSLRLTAGTDTGRLDMLLDALDAGKGYEELLDTDEILRFFACLAIYGADSTFLTEQNNFYLCDTGEKFILLPWDNSEAFAGYETTNGIDHYRMDPWEDIDYPPPLFTLLMENEENRVLYHSYLRQFNEGFLSPSIIDPYLNRLAGAVQSFLQRDVTMVANVPYQLPLTPEESEYGSLQSLLEVFHAIHENIEAQLNGKTSFFYTSTAYAGLSSMFNMNDMQEIIAFLTSNTPTVDPEITTKICAAYPVWCRSVGIIPFDSDNPIEIAFCLTIFCSEFFLVVMVSKMKRGQKSLSAKKRFENGEEAKTE